MKFFRFWFPALGYSGIIFYVSGLPSSGEPLPFPHADKLIHAIEYSILGFLFSRALKGTTPLAKGGIFIRCVVFCVLFGLSDELHQMFVPTREADLGDVVADAVGGFLGGKIFKR